MSRLTIEVTLDTDNEYGLVGATRVMVDGEPIGILQSLSIYQGAQMPSPQIALIAWDYGKPEDYTEENTLPGKLEEMQKTAADKLAFLEKIKAKFEKAKFVKFHHITPRG